MDFIWNKIQFAITDLDGGKLGEKIPMHVHAKGCYELHFVTEGKGTLIADGREIELKKNDFFINFLALKIPPDVYSTSRGLFFLLSIFYGLAQNLIPSFLCVLSLLGLYENFKKCFLKSLIS